MAIPFWIVPVLELEGPANSHSHFGLLFGQLQLTLHEAAPESHSETAIGPEISNLDN